MLNNKIVTFAALALIMAAGPAWAVGTVYSPNVHKGELELEYSGSATFDSQNSKGGGREHELEVSYGLTDRVALEAELVFEKESDTSLRMHAIELISRVQFFEQGEHWLDSGLRLAYAHGIRSEDVDALEAKLLLEKQWGSFLHRANIGLEHEVGSGSEGGFERSFRWSSHYRHDESFEPGFEIQSDLGRFGKQTTFNSQEHYIGPAIYGRLDHHFKYELGYLFGVSDAAADGVLRWQLEYEIHF